MADLRQSTATTRMVFMTDSSDHVSGKAGLTLTITASKAGGAFASISPTVTDRGDGWYALALTTSHTDTLGDLALHVTATGADPTDKLFNVVAALTADVPGNVWDYATASAVTVGSIGVLVKTALPLAAPGGADGLWVLGTNSGPVTFGGSVAYQGAVSYSAGVQIQNTGTALAVVSNSGIGLQVLGGTDPNCPAVMVRGSGANRGLQISGGGDGADAVYIDAPYDGFHAVHLVGSGAGSSGLYVEASSTAVVVTSSQDAGLAVSSTAGIGVIFQGGGSGAGLDIHGGSDGGHGLLVARGSAAADDVFLANSDAPTLRDAVLTAGAITSTVAPALPDAVAGQAGGLWILGANAAAATSLTGASFAPALTLTGGSNAAGLAATGGSGNTNGMTASGQGAGSALRLVGGSYGLRASGAVADVQLENSTAPTLASVVLAGGDVDGYTLEQALKGLLAALAGKLSGAGTTTVTIRAADDSKDRVVATVDADGNRTAVTLDLAG